MKEKTPKVYVIQQIPGTSEGTPRINILGAREYGDFVFCLPEKSQIIFSPGPLIFKLRALLKDYTTNDYLLLTGDPAIIGVACSIVSDITNGKINFDKLIATPATMSKIGKLGKILGPKGLMPNPKFGTVTNDIKNSVKAIKNGQIEIKNDKRVIDAYLGAQ